MVRRGQAVAPFREFRAFARDVSELIDRESRVPLVVQGVKERLASVLTVRPSLPDVVRRPTSDCYARHLLYVDPRGRFEMVVMAWAPGQGTPVHDHSGMWCVEGVCEGVVDVTRYDLKEMVGADVARMEPIGVIHAGLGQCGALIPPVEYHTITNPYQDLALTVHVYGGRMRTCRIFLDRGDDLYQVAHKSLSFASQESALAAVS